MIAYKVSKLKESLARKQLSHALLLETPEGAINELESFFRSILCQEQKAEACGKCDSCRVPLHYGGERQHPDFWAVNPASDTAYTVEQVREWEAHFLYLSKNVAPKKLLVIPNAEKLTGTQNAAANALLKILEEPRPHTHLILLSSNTLRLLHTIRSRCLKVNLKSELKAVTYDIGELGEIQEALWGRFNKDSQLSNAGWWKNKSERITELEEKVPLLWHEAKTALTQSSTDEASRFWTRWKHFEDFLWAIRHYGNPSLHWLNFKRKVLVEQTWRISKLFG